MEIKHEELQGTLRCLDLCFKFKLIHGRRNHLLPFWSGDRCRTAYTAIHGNRWAASASRELPNHPRRPTTTCSGSESSHRRAKQVLLGLYQIPVAGHQSFSTFNTHSLKYGSTIKYFGYAWVILKILLSFNLTLSSCIGDVTSGPNPPLVRFFVVVQLLGGIGIALMLLTALISHRVRRHSTWISFCVSWIISVGSYTLLWVHLPIGIAFRHLMTFFQ